MSKQTQLEEIVVVRALAYAHRNLHESTIGPIESGGFDQLVQFGAVLGAFHAAVLELAAYLTSQGRPAFPWLHPNLVPSRSKMSTAPPAGVEPTRTKPKGG